MKIIELCNIYNNICFSQIPWYVGESSQYETIIEIDILK